MASARSANQWIAGFRALMKQSTAPNWCVKNNRGKFRLQVRDDRGITEQSVSLPYDWTDQGAADALERIRQIFKRYIEDPDITLKIASEIVDTSSSHQVIMFDEMVSGFRKSRPQASDDTWRKKYVPVLSHAKRLMEAGRRPKDGHELCLEALEQWPHGSRQRQIMRRNLDSFLRWAVERGHLKRCYLPPEHQPEILKPKRVGYPLTDAQILRLIESVPDERWRFALQLCSVYGLRPEELRWLKIKNGSHGAELWSIYGKSKGGRKGETTDPRRLHPLLLRDHQATVIDWKIESRLRIKEELPPLGMPGKGGEALRTYLRRKPVWKSLVKEAKENGEELTPYTFRHRYAKASHARGIAIAQIAEAMGHTIEVHMQNYARFKPDNTASIYAEANLSLAC